MKKLLFLALLFGAVSAHAGPGLLERLGLGGDPEPPSVDEAFAFSASVQDAGTLALNWQVMAGNYLYRDALRFEIIDNDDVQLREASLPAGENKVDDYFGLTEVYQHDLEVTLPLDRPAAAQQISLKVGYQGCSETFNICYPPTEKTVRLTLPAMAQASVAAPAIPASQPQQSDTAALNEQDRLAQKLENDSLPAILAGFFGLGLLLAFTPCVFPMIPILSSIIVGEGEHITSRRAFALSLVYVLAMSVTYTAAGIITGLLGENLQALFQNSWVITGFSALFVLLALSMFGFYELQLPQSLQQRLHLIGRGQRGGKLLGVAAMGLLSGLIVGPCLAPPLAGALLFISQHADPLLGGAALFALSIGMGVPLLVIGTSTGSLLPKAGDWMNTIKAFFGVLLLALAIWMLERILPGWISLLLWGGLLVVTAVYLGALNSLQVDASGWQKLWKGTGIILLIYGALLLIGGASGGDNAWRPLSGLAQAERAQAPSLQFSRIDSMQQLEQAIASSSRPLMLDFYADWCTDCKAMERTTFRDPAVVAALDAYTLLKVDMTANTEDHQAILKALRVFGPPTMLFYDENGVEQRAHRLVGHIDAAGMVAHLAQLR